MRLAATAIGLLRLAATAGAQTRAELAELSLEELSNLEVNLPITPVPAYTAVDARSAWGLLDGLELSVVGQNLFDERHPESGAAPGRSEFEHSVLVPARWSR